MKQKHTKTRVSRNSAPEPLPDDQTAHNATPDAGNGLSGKLTFQRIASLVEMPASTVREIIVVKGKMEGRGGIELGVALPLIIRHYRDQAEAAARDEKSDRARMTKANADEAELDLGKKLGTLVPKARMEQIILNGLTVARENIRRMTGLTMEQKLAVCEIIASVTLEEPTDEPT